VHNNSVTTAALVLGSMLLLLGMLMNCYQEKSQILAKCKFRTSKKILLLYCC